MFSQPNDIFEKLAMSHEKKIFTVQRIKRLLAQEECTQRDIEEILESLAYDYSVKL